MQMIVWKYNIYKKRDVFDDTAVFFQITGRGIFLKGRRLIFKTDDVIRNV